LSAASLDLSDVSREDLPIGVPKVMASRMRLDAESAPALLDLRMNYRNLLNEFTQHKGKIVSHQYALMKPRRKSVWEMPKQLEVPEGCDPHLFRKVARKRANEKRLKEEGAILAAANRLTAEEEANFSARDRFKAGEVASYPVAPGQTKTQESEFTDVSSSVAAGEEEQDEESMMPAASRDPTANLEVQELMNDSHVRGTFEALQDPPDSWQMPEARIPRALEALGYFDVEPATISSAIKSLLRPGFHGRITHLHLTEFCVVVHVVATRRQEKLRNMFRDLDRDKNGTMGVREFRHLLWDLGFTVADTTVQEIFREVDADSSGQIELVEFEEALRVLHERHGFTLGEASELMAIFDRYDTDNSGEMSAPELASALGWFGTPTTIVTAEEIIRRFDDNTNANLCRCEFLMVMRWRLEDEHTKLRALFAQFDTSSRGSLSGHQLGRLFRGLGYTIQQEVIQESIRDLGPATTQMGVIFEDVCRLLTTIRSREGFSATEKADMLAVYRQNDKAGKGELREFELAHAVNFLGYPLSHSRRRTLWCQVDVDKNNYIDETEFLKLVRLLREDETAAVEALLEKCAGQGKLRDKDIKEMLGSLGYKLPEGILAAALKQKLDSTDDGQADLWGMLSMLRFIRKQMVDSLRKTCGLSEELAERVKKRFKAKLDAGKRIDAADFEKYMYELHRDARSSPEEREKIKTLIQDHCENGQLGLQEMFWVVRLYSDALEEGKLAKEKDASQTMGFSEQQVAQFKHAFVAADDDGSGQLSEDEIRKLFADVADLSPSQVSLLNLEINNLGPNRNNINFAEFLRILGVIMDDDED